jgi:hypothetical protein
MPNFWTKTSQKISEAFSGPRTRDTEFDQKVEEFKNVERGVNTMKQYILSFLNYTQTLKAFSRDMNNSIKGVYELTSPFALVAKEIYEAHLDLEKFHDNWCNKVSVLQKEVNDWHLLFADVKNQLTKRDTLRKTYDHYDEKLEKLYRTKQDKFKKNLNETNKEIELLTRVRSYIII